MKFCVQPTDVAAYSRIAPAVVVELKDSGDSEVVKLSLYPATSGVALFGSVSRDTVNGKATFDDLSIGGTGSFHLVATVDKYEVMSDMFHVR